MILISIHVQDPMNALKLVAHLKMWCSKFVEPDAKTCTCVVRSSVTADSEAFHCHSQEPWLIQDVQLQLSAELSTSVNSFKGKQQMEGQCSLMSQFVPELHGAPASYWQWFPIPITKGIPSQVFGMCLCHQIWFVSRANGKKLQQCGVFKFSSRSAH